MLRVGEVDLPDMRPVPAGGSSGSHITVLSLTDILLNLS